MPAIPCDVTDESSVQRLFAGAVEALGHLDVVVNNAGLGGTADVVDMTDDQWNAVLDVTLNGTFRCMRAALRAHVRARHRRHRQQRVGYRLARPGRPGPLRGGQGRRHGADALPPPSRRRRTASGSTPWRRAWRCTRSSPRSTTDELLDELTRREAFGRAAEPWEVANVIVFLASDYSSYMTGEVVSVSAQHP